MNDTKTFIGRDWMDLAIVMTQQELNSMISAVQKANGTLIVEVKHG